MRTAQARPDSETPSQQINVRTNVEFFKFLMDQKNSAKGRISLGDVILRAAARGFGKDEDSCICPKAPPGPPPRLQPAAKRSRNGKKAS